DVREDRIRIVVHGQGRRLGATDLEHEVLRTVRPHVQDDLDLVGRLARRAPDRELRVAGRVGIGAGGGAGVARGQGREEQDRPLQATYGRAHGTSGAKGSSGASYLDTH